MTRRINPTKAGWALAALAILILGGACSKGGPEMTAQQEAGQEIFNRSCTTCHTIGQGDRIGPDLAGISDKRDHDWLVRWIDDPIGMSATDPLGIELLAQWKGVPMSDSLLDIPQVEEVLAYINWASEQGGVGVADEAPIELDEAKFAEAKQIYFDRCAGCHGTLRAGATGPNIQPERTAVIGTTAIKAILNNGLPGGMPPWGRMGILSQDEIEMMASYVQQDPPTPPQLPLEQIIESWNLFIPVADRPTAPQTDRDWQNFVGIILRDAGQVAILDGGDKELLAIIETGFAVHILRSSSTGRYFYAIGRDGKVSMIDLWSETPTLVAQAQGCFDARSVDASKYKGFEDKLVIEGCYWPPQYVVFDGQTLEPLKVEPVLTPTYDTDEPLEEVRVAAIVASHYDPLWVVSLKESGHVALVDYSKPDFPMVAKIPSERFLHDGGLDHTGRYFMVAANMRDTMVVIDLEKKEMATKFKTGIKPHPGRGANWEDPEFGWVNTTTHLGEAKMAIYGADPENHPEHAWQVVREIELPSTGGLFVKTHPKSKWVWFDSPLSAEEDLTRQICVYSKAEAKVHKCWQPVDFGRTVHFEYNKEGTEVWVSAWDRKGQLLVYNDDTLEEIERITGDWLVTPTGKFNVYNTAADVY